MTTENPKNTVALSADGLKAITVENNSYVLRVMFNGEWVRSYFWDQEIADMMRKIPTEPMYALKWANKASGVPYA